MRRGSACGRQVCEHAQLGVRLILLTPAASADHGDSRPLERLNEVPSDGGSILVVDWYPKPVGLTPIRWLMCSQFDSGSMTSRRPRRSFATRRIRGRSRLVLPAFRRNRADHGPAGEAHVPCECRGGERRTWISSGAALPMMSFACPSDRRRDRRSCEARAAIRGSRAERAALPHSSACSASRSSRSGALRAAGSPAMSWPVRSPAWLRCRSQRRAQPPTIVRPGY